VRGRKPGTRCAVGRPCDGIKKVEVYERGRFFTMTGQPLNGCRSIEERQQQLETLYDELFLQPAPSTSNSTRSLAPPSASLDDQDLLERAVRAYSGDAFRSLWNGDWRLYYPSQSEADLAFCSMLAFWTGRDACRMDALFRRSSLMRDKWDARRGDS